MSIEQLEQQLQALRPGLSIPPALREDFAALPDPKGFARHFGHLIASELSGDHRRPDHHKRTKADKAFFHAAESRLSGRLLGLAHPPVGRVAEAGPLGAYDDASVAAAVKALETDGCFVWPERLSAALCDRYIELLSGQTFRERGSDVLVEGYDAATAERHGSNAVDINDQNDLIPLPEFQALAFDPMLVDVAQRYMGCCPVHTQVNSWWSIDAQRDRKALSSTAQLFHQDKDFVRFVKAFLYLTDVEDDTGPHVYVKGSHNDYEERFGGAKEPFSKRFDDAEVAAIFGADRIRPLTGPRGTLVLADTSGFHKGAPVLRGHRLLIQLEWCCSLFLTPQAPAADADLPPSSQALKAAHPRLFANYDGEALAAWRRDSATAGKPKGVLGRLSNSVKKRLPF